MKTARLACLAVFCAVIGAAFTADEATLKATGVTALFLAGSAAFLFCALARRDDV